MSQQEKVVLPKHTHYARVDSGEVYPAMKTPSGYEDKNPGAWRPATQAEIAAFVEQGKHERASMGIAEDATAERRRQHAEMMERLKHKADETAPEAEVEKVDVSIPVVVTPTVVSSPAVEPTAVDGDGNALPPGFVSPGALSGFVGG